MRRPPVITNNEESKNNQNHLDFEDFETVLDVFRTLLKWSDELERNKESEDGCCHNQSDFVGSAK